MKTLSILVILLSLDSFSSATWKKFKSTHQKHYRNLHEDEKRRQIYEKNVAKVKQHNELYKKHLATYEQSINEFSDYTDEEVEHALGGLIVPLDEKPPLISITPASQISDLPNAFDWRAYNIVTPVKYQGGCGSCWAFSTIGALEAQYTKIFNKIAILSEQQLVDCVSKAHGCNGGWMSDAYGYIRDNNGISYSDNYPYTATNNSCSYDSTKPKISIKGYGVLSQNNEELLKEVVVKHGPVAIAMDTAGDFSKYSNGVYFNPTCRNNSYTHAMVIVGYGHENGMDYWLVKNSWGGNWGDKGFVKVARNKNSHCGIANKVSYPIL